MGETVDITANTPSAGMRFDVWNMSGPITYANSTSSTDAAASFTMPSFDVTATANYQTVITVNSHPVSTAVTAGSITESLSVSASVLTPYALSYQWYENTTNSNTGGTAISGETNASFAIPATLTQGAYYYYCIVSATGNTTDLATNFAMVAVFAPSSPLTFIGSFSIPASVVGTPITSLSVAVGANGGSTPYTFTATGLPAGITISTTGVISGTPTATSPAGLATVIVTDAALATASVTVSYGAITTSTQPATYTVNIDTPVGGSVTTNKSSAAAGETVTLTITPDAGYELESINVYNLNNSSTRIPLSGVGMIRTFTMPAHHVTVVAVFSDTSSTGMENMGEHTGSPIRAYVNNGTLHVSGLTPGQLCSVYNVSGSLIFRGIANSNHIQLILPNHGMYLVTDGKQLIKIVN